MTIHSLISLSAEGWCSDSCYRCSTPLKNWTGDATAPRTDMDVVIERYTSMPVIEPQVAQCHIHITKLFQHSNYMQKGSTLWTANVVLHHCSLPGCTK